MTFTPETIVYLSKIASATLLGMYSTLLFLRGSHNRSRRILAVSLLPWLIANVIQIIGIALDIHCINYTSFPLFAPVILATGNLLIIFLLLYPIEILWPGWLNFRRTCLLLGPYAIVTLVYVVLVQSIGCGLQRFYDYSTMMDSFGNFNVWYRVIFVILGIVYIIVLLDMIRKSVTDYQIWKENNCTENINTDLSWLRNALFALSVILVTFLLVLSVGKSWCIILHSWTINIGLGYIVYKGIFHENPYPEGFFAQTMDEDTAEKLYRPDETIPSRKASLPTEESFDSKIDHYVQAVTSWMESERPYLYKDFKLMDVAEVLPLNRSYLSRVFNEGMGKSFSKVVRDYRLEYAKDLLEHRKDCTVETVSEMSGFSSSSTFIRSFIQETGMSPNRYRNSRRKR